HPRSPGPAGTGRAAFRRRPRRQLRRGRPDGPHLLRRDVRDGRHRGPGPWHPRAGQRRRRAAGGGWAGARRRSAGHPRPAGGPRRHRRRTARLVRRAGRAAPAEGRRPGPARRAGRLGEHRTEPGGRPAPAAGRTPEGRMTEQATTTHAGTIPSQPGPRQAADAATGPRGGTVTSGSDPAGPAVIPGAGPAAPSAARPGERATVRLRDTGGEEPARYAPEWLQLREPADAVARSHDLLDPLRIRLANLPQRADGLVIHDIGCGTGSMGRWLAPHLDGAQHWILHDRDPYLLHFAAVGAPRSSADGSRVSVETRRGDVARLTPDALAGASLVT